MMPISSHVQNGVRLAAAHMTKDLTNLLDCPVDVRPGWLEWGLAASKLNTADPFMANVATISDARPEELFILFHARDALVMAGTFLMVPKEALAQMPATVNPPAQYRDAFDEICNLLSSTLDIALQVERQSAAVHIRQAGTQGLPEGPRSWPLAKVPMLLAQFTFTMAGMRLSPHGILVGMPPLLVSLLGR